jgi:predicted anti-sigma-YlaC factor YlaD
VADPGCLREFEALEAIQDGRWPDGCETELREHVNGCTTCRELVTLAGALLDERNAAVREAPIPGSGLVWWRIQMRARREAQRNATRTLAAVQAAAVIAALGIGVGILGATSLPEAATWLAKIIPTSPSAPALARWATPLLLALGTWLSLAPVAVWLAVTEEKN